MTIIIPAHNSAATMRVVLESLVPQCGPGDEVLVVDDGSEDETPAILREAARTFRGRLWVMRQDRLGPAAARNTALRVAASPLVLFLGADIIPSSTLLAKHRAVHARYPEDTVGCVGFVTWDPRLPPSPLMVWLEHGGSQNAYGMIAGHHWVRPGSFFYAANLSCKRLLLDRVGGFDAEHFPSYGWEDLDLGMRLAAVGLTLLYEPAARGLHHHQHTLSSWLQRQRQVGRQWRVLQRQHPARLQVPRRALGWRYILRAVCAFSFVGYACRALAQAHQTAWILPRVYRYVCAWEFTKSVHYSLSKARMHVDKSPVISPQKFVEAGDSFLAL